MADIGEVDIIDIKYYWPIPRF